MDALKDLKKLDRDDILEALGLQQRDDASDYVLPALGLFGAGLLVGAGLGLILAPRPGRVLRKELGKRATSLADRAKNAVEDIGS